MAKSVVVRGVFINCAYLCFKISSWFSVFTVKVCGERTPIRTLDTGSMPSTVYNYCLFLNNTDLLMELMVMSRTEDLMSLKLNDRPIISVTPQRIYMGYIIIYSQLFILLYHLLFDVNKQSCGSVSVLLKDIIAA